MTDVARAVPDWPALITEAVAGRVAPVTALTFLEKRSSASRPIKVSCSDGQTYFVKGRHAGRQGINDHVVAHLGAAFGAPSGRPGLVTVTNELVTAEPALHDLFGSGRFQPGTWHGSLVLENVSNDREGIAHQQVAENRLRYSQLAILFGWASGSDHQFLFNKQDPRLVYSVDHGHFFLGGPDWSVASLSQQQAAAVPDATLSTSCLLTSAELKAAGSALAAIDEVAVIASAVASPLDDWGISLAERVALAQYLARRHRELVGAIGALPN